MLVGERVGPAAALQQRAELADHVPRQSRLSGRRALGAGVARVGVCHRESGVARRVERLHRCEDNRLDRDADVDVSTAHEVVVVGSPHDVDVVVRGRVDELDDHAPAEPARTGGPADQDACLVRTARADRQRPAGRPRVDVRHPLQEVLLLQVAGLGQVDRRQPARSRAPRVVRRRLRQRPDRLWERRHLDARDRRRRDSRGRSDEKATGTGRHDRTQRRQTMPAYQHQTPPTASRSRSHRWYPGLALLKPTRAACRRSGPPRRPHRTTRQSAAQPPSALPHSPSCGSLRSARLAVRALCRQLLRAARTRGCERRADSRGAGRLGWLVGEEQHAGRCGCAVDEPHR